MNLKTVKYSNKMSIEEENFRMGEAFMLEKFRKLAFSSTLTLMEAFVAIKCLINKENKEAKKR